MCMLSAVLSTLMAGIFIKSNLGARTASETHEILLEFSVTMTLGEDRLLGGFLLSNVGKLGLKLWAFMLLFSCYILCLWSSTVLEFIFLCCIT